MSDLVSLSDSNLPKVVASEQLVLVDFWAPWCRPCLVMAPVLAELEEETGIRLTKVNADDSPKSIKKHGIMGLPTLILFERGEERARAVGAMSKEALKETLAL